jgi:hypothetical protein
MKKNGGLSRKTISNSGFYEHSPGMWKKRDANSPPKHSTSQAEKLERDIGEGDKREHRAKEKGKKVNSTGYVYQLVVVSYRSRPIDASNCCPKYVEDALVDAGFIPDDNIFFCPTAPICHQIIGIKEIDHRTEVFLFKIKK